MKVVYTGLESAGKSLLLAQKVGQLVKGNRRWEKKHGFARPIFSNLRINDAFYEANKDIIHYWDDMRDIIGLTGCDIIWDEISSDFSALKKEPLPKNVNRWLRQGAKQGVHIYATAQEFHDIHLDFRRRVAAAYHVRKLVGSQRGGENLPPVPRIWGLVQRRALVIHPYNELQPEMQLEGLFSAFGLTWISPGLARFFDTHQVIPESEYPPYDHALRVCSRKDCKYKRIFHA